MCVSEGHLPIRVAFSDVGHPMMANGSCGLEVQVELPETHRGY